VSNIQDDIIKYKNGQLTEKEMHALERKALNDPFLADALEGMESISEENLSQDIAELNRRVLKQKRSILFTPLRIAAGVILIAASVIVLYQLTPETKTIALKSEKPSSPVVEPKKEPSTETKKVQPKQEEKIAAVKKDQGPKTHNALGEKSQPAVSKLIEAKTDIAEKTEVAKPKGEVQSEVTIAQTLSAPEKKSEEVKPELKDAPVAIAVQPTQELANEDAQKEKAASRARRSTAKAPQYQGGAGLAKANQATNRSISGRVVSAEDGEPLPGVNVIIEGTTEGTVTDASGNFTMQTASESQRLVFSFISMKTQEEDIKGRDKIDVTLKQDASQLSEVVVSGFSAKRDDDTEPIVHLASPIGGMRAYNKYLDANVRYPQQALTNNIKGKVKVEFSVKTDGSLDDYKVVKGLGFGCDEEVIRLIKDGPKWSPSTENGRPVESTVLVGVKFDPAKSGR